MAISTSIILGLGILIFVFLVLAYLIEKTYLKLFSLSISLGWCWILLAAILQFSQDFSSSSNIITLMNGAYTYGVYTFITIYSLIGVYALASLFIWFYESTVKKRVK